MVMPKRKSFIYTNCVVEKWVDADTIWMKAIVSSSIDVGFGIIVTSSTEIKQNLRVLAYDAPETFKPRNAAEKQHGLEATAYAKKLIGENTFTAETFKGDEYGRYLANITLIDGRDFAIEMIKARFQKRESY